MPWHDITVISETDVDKFFPQTTEGRQSAITAALNAPCKYINIYATAGDEPYACFGSLYKDLARAYGVHLFFNEIDVSPLMEQIREELVKDIDIDRAEVIKQMTADSVAHLMSCLDDQMFDTRQKETIQDILKQPQFASAMSAATNQLHGNLMLAPMAAFLERSLKWRGALIDSAGKNPTLDWGALGQDEIYVYINMNDDAPGKLAVKSTYIRPFLVSEGICAIASSAIFDVTSDCAGATLETMNLKLKPVITGCIATS